MPRNASGASESLVLAAALTAIAIYFSIRQWRDRLGRGGSLSEADALHFARQDARRWFGSAVMALLAAGIVIGTRIVVRGDRTRGRLFLAVWIVVAVLVGVLLVLALVDWLATIAYARRQRAELARERRAAIDDQRRGFAASGNGRPGTDYPEKT
ncbi:MAG: hypothetical protein ABI353_15510 [Isosphaeraceae bacterium]